MHPKPHVQSHICFMHIKPELTDKINLKSKRIHQADENRFAAEVLFASGG